MDEAERFESLLLVLGELAEANLTTPIVVEGPRDVAALRRLALRGEVVPLNQGSPLFAFCEVLAQTTASVILLTDWDRKGGQLYATLQAGLEACGVRVDGTYRDKIQFWMRPPVRAVEDLAGYVDRGLHRYRHTTLDDHQWDR